jgi:hypothetical protein
MNSRFVPLTSAIVSLLIAIFCVYYFDGWWRWLIASPILVFISWPSFKIGILSPQSEVDEMTGADKLEEPVNSYLLLMEIIYFSRYLLYAGTMYLSFKITPLYIFPLLAIACCLIRTLNPIRFNMAKAEKRKNGFYGLAKIYPFFYMQDLIIIGVLYGLGILVRNVL